MTNSDKPLVSVDSSDNVSEVSSVDLVRAAREACNTVLNAERLAEFCPPEVAEKFCNRWSLERLDELVKRIKEYDSPRIGHFFPGWAINLSLHERESQSRELDERLVEAESFNEGMATLLELWSRVTNMHPKHLVWMHLMEEKQGYVYIQSLMQTLSQLARFSDFEIAEDRKMHHHLLMELRFGAETTSTQKFFLNWAGTPPAEPPPSIL